MNWARAILLLPLAACAQAGADNARTPLERPDRFLIAFPDGWVQPAGEDRNPSPTGFYIASSANGVEGVSLAQGDADILVHRVQGDNLTRLADAVEALRIPDEQLLSSQHLPVTVGEEPDCASPAEAVTRDEMGPGAMMIVTRLVCRVGNARFLVLLRYWEGEPRAQDYRRIVLEVTRSIRFQ